ncbi:MAG: ABC transporter permease, partial [Roseiflexaceae bacterium]
SKAFFQITIVCVIGVLTGATLPHAITEIARGFVALLCFTLGFAGIALAVAARSRSIMGYHGMIFLFNLPLLFASNALYELDAAPTWMQWVAQCNPATWLIAVMRSNELALVYLSGLVVFAVLGTWFALQRFHQLTK